MTSAVKSEGNPNGNLVTPLGFFRFSREREVQHHLEATPTTSRRELGTAQLYRDYTFDPRPLTWWDRLRSLEYLVGSIEKSLATQWDQPRSVST